MYYTSEGIGLIYHVNTVGLYHCTFFHFIYIFYSVFHLIGIHGGDWADVSCTLLDDGRPFAEDKQQHQCAAQLKSAAVQNYKDAKKHKNTKSVEVR